MNSETQTIEYKSLPKIRTGDKGFKELSTTCVALANAQGGVIYIGFDDKKKHTLPDQIVAPDEDDNTVTRLRSLCFNVALYASEVLTDETDSQYFTITVAPSMKSIAYTSDGKFYMRFADKCEPVRSEDMLRLSEIKGCFQWEITQSRFAADHDSMEKLDMLADEIRSSNRISDHIRQMDNDEIADYYCLIYDGFLTNLGVLWLGTSKQKNWISYPITVQYIVYDAEERKIRKVEWRNDDKNPKELQLADDERLRSYTQQMVKKGLVLQKGVSKGSYYIINPVLIKNTKADKIPTTLRTIETNVLETLILQDLKKHPGSKISEIATRLPEAELKEIRKIVYNLVDKTIKAEDVRNSRKYSLI